VTRPLCFLQNSKSGRATFAAKYEKDRKGNREDVAFLKWPDVM
jgi:hypothetical protein